MNNPVVSVCIPTYNYAEFLGRAVQSVLDQSFAEFELLVYDDASTDNTVDVMQPFLADPRVKLVVNEQNQGLFGNFNLAASESRGRYVKYLCADDWLDERFLARTVPLLEADADLSFATTAHWHADENGRLTAEQYGPFGDDQRVDGGFVARQLAQWGNVVGMPTNTLIRRELLERCGGFDADYAPSADVQLWLKLLAEGDMGWVNEKLCYWRIHGQHTHSYGDDPCEAIFRVWADAPAIENSPATAEVCRLGIDRQAVVAGQYAIAHSLGFRFDRAADLIRMARQYVGTGRLITLLARSLSAGVIDQLRRFRAQRAGRIVVYNPRPHVGPRLREGNDASKPEGSGR